jgi:WD40 repeat protein
VAERREVASVPLPLGDWSAALAFAPDDRSLFACSQSQLNVSVWDLVAGHEFRRLTKHPKTITGFALGPGAKSFITVVDELDPTATRVTHTARGWDVDSEQELWAVSVGSTYPHFESAPFAVTRDGRRLAFISYSQQDTQSLCTVILYDLPPPPE